MKTVLLACDRSGGHIFPALALAKELRKRQKDNVRICFFATSASLKCYCVEEGFPVLGKTFSSRNLLYEGFFRFVEAFYVIIKVRPRSIVGFGGRDSFFLIFFGSLFFIETLIYEPNIKLGKANKILSYFVRKVLAGFQEGFKSKKKCVVGIPLRENIRIVDKKEARRALGFTEEPVIFCFGGSQGSSFLNNVCMRLVKELSGNYQIIHLTGKREYFQIMQFYNTIEKRKFVKDFSYSVETLYSAADVVISRCGASTLGEIAYYRLPAILIPHPQAGGHQKDNAFYFKDRGAAFVFLQNEFSFEEFKRTAAQLLTDERLREELKSNLGKIKLGVNVEEFCNSVVA